MVTKKCRVQDIQSVAGGWIVGKDDKLYTYVSGRASNMALDQTGLLTLRRDGKCSSLCVFSGSLKDAENRLCKPGLAQPRR